MTLVSDMHASVKAALGEELRFQNPDALIGDHHVRLSGGVTPQSAGCALDLDALAEAVIGAFPMRALIDGLRKRADRLRSEYLRGGSREHLSPREDECRALADMLERGRLPS